MAAFLIPWSKSKLYSLTNVAGSNELNTLLTSHGLCEFRPYTWKRTPYEEEAPNEIKACCSTAPNRKYSRHGSSNEGWGGIEHILRSFKIDLGILIF